MIEKINVEKFKYTSEQKREKMLFDKVNELVGHTHTKEEEKDGG